MKKDFIRKITLFAAALAICPSFIFSTIYAEAKTTTPSAVNIIAKAEKNIDLVILFNNNRIDKDVEKVVENSGGKVVKEFSDLGGIEVSCPSSVIPTIQSNSNVESLAPNHVIKISAEKVTNFSQLSNTITTSSDLYEKYQWDIKKVTHNGESFKLESGNHNVVVGIIDSGVDTTHPDLVNNFLGGKNLVPANFNDDSSETGDLNDVTDRYGHGTNVAGEIAANGRTKGIAPNIGFKSYRIFNAEGETNATICSSAIMQAVNDKVKVINLSIESYDLKGRCYWTDTDTGIKYKLGDDMAEYSLLKRAIKYATKNGITVVAAAGNKGLDCSNGKDLTTYLNNTYGNQGYNYTGLTYVAPGDIKDVITVSATKKNDTLASYSNYGKKYIDIAAPGGDISETDPVNNMCFTTEMNSQYILTNGTSFAAPKVSAVAALIICRDSNCTPKKVAKKIYKTADELNDGKSSQYYGSGIVDAFKAIQ